jgi:hypothetical protein
MDQKPLHVPLYLLPLFNAHNAYMKNHGPAYTPDRDSLEEINEPNFEYEEVFHEGAD